MSTPSAGRAAVGVLPSPLTLVRLLGQDAYEAQFRLSARTGQPREWLVVTPRNALHPHHQPRHWLGDPTEGWQGPAAQLPCALHCPVNLSGLRTDTEHRATVYLALRSGPDEVTTERLTVIVTPARALATMPEPTPSLAALGTPMSAAPSLGSPPLAPDTVDQPPACVRHPTLQPPQELDNQAAGRPEAVDLFPRERTGPISDGAFSPDPGYLTATPAHAPAVDPASLIPLSAPQPPAPAPPDASMMDQTATFERFCAKCGRPFIGVEKFCPKDGRLRQNREGS